MMTEGCYCPANGGVFFPSEKWEWSSSITMTFSLSSLKLTKICIEKNKKKKTKHFYVRKRLQKSINPLPRYAYSTFMSKIKEKTRCPEAQNTSLIVKFSHFPFHISVGSLVWPTTFSAKMHIKVKTISSHASSFYFFFSFFLLWFNILHWI